VTEQYCSLDLPNVDIYSNHFYQLIAANNTESKLQQDSNNVKNNKHKVYYVGEYDWTGNGDTISLSQWLSDIENDSVSLDTYWSLFPHNDTHGFVWHCDGFTLHYTGDNQTAISNNCPGSYSFSDM